MTRMHAVRFKTGYSKACVLLGLLAVSILALQSLDASAATINVFLVGGQSNADGRADSSELPDNLKVQPDVLYYSNATKARLTVLQPAMYPGYKGAPPNFGPEITFGRGMADYYAAKQEKVAIVKFAWGGTNLFLNWKADGKSDSSQDGPQYRQFQKAVRQGLTELKKAYPDDEIVLRGMIWMQGEGDTEAKTNAATNGAYSLAYAKNLTEFIRDVRATFGSNIPFAIGKLSDNQKACAEEYRKNVQKCQEDVVKNDPTLGIVRTEAFSLKPDKLHFDADGQRALGDAFAQEMKRLLQLPKKGKRQEGR